MPIAPTPAVLDLSTVELPSTTRGALASVRHSHPNAWQWRRLRHKRWYYVSVANASTLVGCAIVDLGYIAKGFVYVANRDDRALLAHQEVLLPGGPWCRVARTAQGTSGARFSSPTLRLRIVRESSGSIAVRARGRKLTLDAVLETTADPIVAANLLPTAATSVTEKVLAYRARGVVRVDGRSFDLTDALGASDYTDGYLPRRTIWRWASVSADVAGRELGLNLVQGFMGACECFATIDGELTTLGEGIIDRPANPMEQWRVRTTCGRVDLSFVPFALHEDNTDLRVIHAKFAQPIGLYSGRVLNLTVDRAIGVCEDQDVLW